MQGLGLRMPNPEKKPPISSEADRATRQGRVPLGEGGGELAHMDLSGEVDEQDLSPGQRRRGGQHLEEE